MCINLIQKHFFQIIFAFIPVYAYAAFAEESYNFQDTLLAAQQGDMLAQNRLGVFYHKGLGVKQDYKAAAKWFEKSAKQGNCMAQYNLGMAYLKAWGLYDLTKGYQYVKQAADCNITEAQTQLGIMYLEGGRGGYALAPSTEKAAEWFKKAAKQGDKTAQDWLKAHTQFATTHQLASQGNAEMLYQEALLHYKGKGATENREQALALFRLAAAKGYPKAQYKLAMEYLTGGVTLYDRTEKADLKNLIRQSESDYYAYTYKQALDLLLKSANAGYVLAQAELGKQYADREEFQNSEKWYRKAAEQGFPSAAGNLALIYKYGNKIINKNLAEAEKWHNKEAEYYQTKKLETLGITNEDY
jgi:hypothetical protein